MKCLMAEVNFSEGRDQSKIDQIKEAMLNGDPIELMEIASDTNHTAPFLPSKASRVLCLRLPSACLQRRSS